MLFAFGLGNAEFDLQKQALSGLRACSVYIDLFDFYCRVRNDATMHWTKIIMFIAFFKNRHHSHTGALFLEGPEAKKVRQNVFRCVFVARFFVWCFGRHFLSKNHVFS